MKRGVEYFCFCETECLGEGKGVRGVLEERGRGGRGGRKGGEEGDGKKVESMAGYWFGKKKG